MELFRRMPDLARALTQTRLELERSLPPTGVSVDLSRPSVVVHWDAAQVSRFPSRNVNTVQVLGHAADVTAERLQELISFYQERGVSLFYFWQDPMNGAKELSDRLRQAGFTPFTDMSYPVLAQVPVTRDLPETEFSVRRLVPGKDEPILGCYGGEADQKRYRDTFGTPGFDHFAAFAEDGEVVSTALLFTSEGASYLHDGGTREGYRRMGAQSALITARVNHAVSLGSQVCLVQTLALLESSLNNLKRGGFQEIFERLAWGYGKAP